MEFLFTNISNVPVIQKNSTLVIKPSLKNTFHKLKTVTLILIICFGLIGNTLNLIVFGKKNMRKISTFRFLFYLSFIDFLVLLIGASDMLVRHAYQFEIRTYSNAFCKLHTYMTYTVIYFLKKIKKGVYFSKELEFILNYFSHGSKFFIKNLI